MELKDGGLPDFNNLRSFIKYSVSSENRPWIMQVTEIFSPSMAFILPELFASVIRISEIQTYIHTNISAQWRVSQY